MFYFWWLHIRLSSVVFFILLFSNCTIEGIPHKNKRLRIIKINYIIFIWKSFYRQKSQKILNLTVKYTFICSYLNGTVHTYRENRTRCIVVVANGKQLVYESFFYKQNLSNPMERKKHY